jgi:hypothetical protein
LESEIERLKKEVERNSSNEDKDEEYAIALEQLEKLKKEKVSLAQKLELQDIQIREQRQMILEQKRRLDALMSKMEEKL